MKNFQIVSMEYTKPDITIHATDGEKVHHIKVFGFQPYFYIPENEVTNSTEYEVSEETYQHEEGFPLKKIILNDPHQVSKIRESFTHYEADIPFLRRFLMDTKITSSFKIQHNSYNRVHYTDLIPTSFSVPEKACYIDFEMDVTTRFPDPDHPNQPVTSWTAYISNRNIYYTVTLNPNTETETVEQWSKEHIVIQTPSEKRLFELLVSFLNREQPHFLANWNGKVADREYPFKRALKEYNIKIPFSNSDEIDMCRGYSVLYRRLYNRLKDVAVEEGIHTEKELIAEEFHKDMHKTDIKKFILYNKMDVEILVKLDLLGWDTIDEDGNPYHEPPRHICTFFWDLKNFVGLEDADSTMYNSVSIDTLTLQEAKEQNLVLNSSHKEKGKSYQGATIFAPPPGLYNNLQIIDMSRYYPNIIVGYNIDPLSVSVVKKLIKRREFYEAEMNRYPINSPEYNVAEKNRTMVKYLLNTNYGYLGSPRSRKYKREKAGLITEKARLGLEIIKKHTEAKTPELLSKFNTYLKELNATPQLKVSKGYPVLYGHTDSLCIQSTTPEIKILVNYLNNVVLKEHCQNENIPQVLSLKHEKTAITGIFVEAQSGDGTAKARYALRITEKDGKPCDYIDIVGLDPIRSNTSKVSRKLQMYTIKSILYNETDTINSYITKIIKNIKNEKYSISEITTPITISKPLKSYPTSTHFIKAINWSIRNLGLEIGEGDRVKLLPVKRVIGKEATKIIAFFDEENLTSLNYVIDYEEIIKKTVQAKIKTLLKTVNLNWQTVSTKSNLKGMFT